MTVGVIACVEVTTTTTGTTPGSTGTTAGSTAPSSGAPATEAAATSTVAPPTSGTTVVPTSVSTTTVCQKDMAVVGGQYVSSVNYPSAQPVDRTNSDDLTSTSGNGIDFAPVPGTTGLVDDKNEPLYQVTIKFNEPGVDSLGSITVNPNSNVNKFAVQFFVASNPDQPVTAAPELGGKPLSLSSTVIGSRASIVDLPSQVPSPLSAIRIVVLSTKDNE